MTEEVPRPALDEPMGDVGDQASRLQMVEEQEAIRAALAGRVHGTDALDDRGPEISPLEGPDALDGDSVEASDDPVHAGGTPMGGTSEPPDTEAGSDADILLVGLEEDGAAMAVEEGSSVEDDASASVFEADGDPDILADPEVDLALEELDLPDDEMAAEDLDALLDVTERTHDPDDPQDPDGYGVPPGADVAGEGPDDGSEEVPGID